MKLRYTGPVPDGVVLLPEGMPAADHDEPDATIAKAKLATGKYEVVKTTEKRDAVTEVN